MKNDEQRNLFITIFISMAILILWQVFYTNPYNEKTKQEREVAKEIAAAELQNKQVKNDEAHLSYESGNFIEIDTPTLSGKISLTGLNFFSLTLKEYKENLDADSPNVQLLNRSNQDLQYFAEFGWLSRDKQVDYPDRKSHWTADSKLLTPEHPVTFTWTSKQNVKFTTIISVDKNYMFDISSYITNNGPNTLSIAPYGLIYRSLPNTIQKLSVIHEGGIGVFNHTLKELPLDDLIESKKTTFNTGKRGWLGYSDKYWLTAIIPSTSADFTANFSGANKDSHFKFQADFTGHETSLKPNESFEYNIKFFAGVKKDHIINKYEEQFDIPLFDHAIDYGIFYFITKPMFKLLTYINKFTNNFGLAIIFMTFLVKLAMFPIANKSYVTMQKMKKIQPELSKIKEMYKNDYIKLNNATIDLYKKEKMSPMSGCLPLLIQIPVFFSLYKVIYISIDMRQAPFYGWIKDLSMPDPTTIFNLFGLFDWSVPAYLMIGAWPIIMALTMYLQQQLNPAPADQTQATVMKFLPLIFLFMFQTFPAGLMIYWSVSNIITIIQQLVVQKIYK